MVLVVFNGNGGENFSGVTEVVVVVVVVIFKGNENKI